MSEQARYQIQVQGWIGEGWASWFDGMAIAYEHDAGGAPIITLTGTVPDQPALRGVLAKIWDLNLTLISVIRVLPKGARSNE